MSVSMSYFLCFLSRLANIYTATSADIKRTILRVLEGPVSCLLLLKDMCMWCFLYGFLILFWVFHFFFFKDAKPLLDC